MAEKSAELNQQGSAVYLPVGEAPAADRDRMRVTLPGIRSPPGERS